MWLSLLSQSVYCLCLAVLMAMGDSGVLAVEEKRTELILSVYQKLYQSVIEFSPIVVVFVSGTGCRRLGLREAEEREGRLEERQGQGEPRPGYELRGWGNEGLAGQGEKDFFFQSYLASFTTFSLSLIDARVQNSTVFIFCAVKQCRLMII
ncbi:hypothetical protein F7725_027998 [Dissostichus mawsoni]|uniref:Uncharacterized protein n=1 Tax=Dissostichus mawsoni TaxID=36200 RepID=A0A7J5XES1_DISMA|nr:hypothetical protein F7725_027998 [Dissostichus mawsoni]